MISEIILRVEVKKQTHGFYRIAFMSKYRFINDIWIDTSGRTTKPGIEYSVTAYNRCKITLIRLDWDSLCMVELHSWYWEYTIQVTFILILRSELPILY